MPLDAVSSPTSALWARPQLRPPSRTRRHSDRVVTSRPGSGSCRGRIRPGASRSSARSRNRAPEGTDSKGSAATRVFRGPSMGGPSAQFFLVGVLRRSELLLIPLSALKPTFGEADPNRSAPGVRKKPGHIPALGGVSAKFLRGDHRPIRSSCDAHTQRRVLRRSNSLAVEGAALARLLQQGGCDAATDGTRDGDGQNRYPHGVPPDVAFK